VTLQIEIVEPVTILRKNRMTIADILFITWNCPDCTRIKGEFEKFNLYAFEDDKVGRQGQSFIVIQTYSNVGARYSLNDIGGFGDEDFTPALLTHKGQRMTDPDKIIIYLRENFK